VFDQFGVAVQDLGAAISLLLPGFIFVWLFDLTSKSTPRDRPDIQSVMLSLSVSLIIYAAVHAFYKWMSWPRDPLDPEFYIGLLLTAASLGYASGRSLGFPVVREALSRAGVLIEPQPWVQALASQRWIIIHLTDGTILYGYPLQ
jgi:hypothetical protein